MMDDKITVDFYDPCTQVLQNDIQIALVKGLCGSYDILKELLIY